MHWLAKFFLTAGGHKVPSEGTEDLDPVEQNIGVHLLSDSGHEHISKKPCESAAIDLINRLDWYQGFFQVIVTSEPGISMEVGGSLNGVDGLSGVYRNRLEEQHLATSIPPQSKGDMVSIVSSFINGDNQWKEKYEFS